MTEPQKNGLMSAYWTLGWHAWVGGVSSRTCPFIEGYARKEWMQGYDDACLTLSK